jgi:hypothetical protein
VDHRKADLEGQPLGVIFEVLQRLLPDMKLHQLFEDGWSMSNDYKTISHIIK